MSLLVRIADQLLNRPLLITPDKAQVILSVLAGRIGINDPELSGGPEASRFVGSSTERDPNGRAVASKPYRIADGVGIITITGSLVNRGAWIGASSGLTSYEGVQHQLRTARFDNTMHSAIIDIHTPGGEAIGAFETAAVARELAAAKPTIAIVNGLAASAGYAIASGASEIVTTETGVSGSIGVVLLHADFSANFAKEGIKPTLIHAGAHKVDGNPFEPLSAEVRGELQAEVDALYQAFLTTVAKGRGGRLTAAAARKTEARTFIGQAAVDAGLADRVGTFESVLAELSRAGGRKTVQTRRTSMDNIDQPAPNANAGISKADHETAVASATETGKKAGATAERERFKAVLGCEHYKGREASANHMLTATDMSAEAIGGVLANLPATTAEAPKEEPKADNRGGLGISTLGAGTPAKAAVSIWDEAVAEANGSLKAGRAI